jgi:hypothetical protein
MLSENDVKVLKAISEGQYDPQSIADKLKIKVEAMRDSADALAVRCVLETPKKVEYFISFRILSLRLDEIDRSLNKGLEIAHLDIGMVSC